MGKGSFRRLLKTPTEKNAAPTCDTVPATDIGNDIINAPSKTGDEAAAVESGGSTPSKDYAHKGEPPSIPIVYDDVSVCRLLGIHRRILAAARTAKARGKDWDCVGLHAGMTKKWIEQEALRRGIVPDFINHPLKPIQPDDKIVSCILVGTWPNRTRVTARVVATGKARIATVRNADDFALYQAFDAFDYGSELTWRADLNDVRY